MVEDEAEFGTEAHEQMIYGSNLYHTEPRYGFPWWLHNRRLSAVHA